MCPFRGCATTKGDGCRCPFFRLPVVCGRLNPSTRRWVICFLHFLLLARSTPVQFTVMIAVIAMPCIKFPGPAFVNYRADPLSRCARSLELHDPLKQNPLAPAFAPLRGARRTPSRTHLSVLIRALGSTNFSLERFR